MKYKVSFYDRNIEPVFVEGKLLIEVEIYKFVDAAKPNTIVAAFSRYQTYIIKAEDKV